MIHETEGSSKPSNTGFAFVMLVIITIGVWFATAATTGQWEIKSGTVLGSVETNTAQAQKIINQAQRDLRNEPLKIQGVHADHVYKNSDAPYSIQVSDKPEDNCGYLDTTTEERKYAAGCFKYPENVITLSSNQGSGDILKAVVLHEFAHYLQYNALKETPSVDSYKGDTETELECQADAIAITLGADRDLLGYTQSGQCVDPEKRVSSGLF